MKTKTFLKSDKKRLNATEMNQVRGGADPKIVVPK